MCSIGPNWKDKPLTLELDHINQINNDNRIENLRFLCPNCHSQVTIKHCNNSRKPKHNTCSCGKEKHISSPICKACADRAKGFKSRKFDPSKESLGEMISLCNYNMCEVARKFGVSDNAVRKRCRLLGVSWKPD